MSTGKASEFVSDNREAPEGRGRGWKCDSDAFNVRSFGVFSGVRTMVLDPLEAGPNASSSPGRCEGRGYT